MVVFFTLFGVVIGLLRHGSAWQWGLVGAVLGLALALIFGSRCIATSDV